MEPSVDDSDKYKYINSLAQRPDIICVDTQCARDNVRHMP